MSHFDSLSGAFHYLIAPVRDEYILNSLERLGFKEFMNRLLREDGYGRVIFFEHKYPKQGYLYHTFDRLSFFSYHYPLKFEKIPIKGIVDRKTDKKALNEFYSEVGDKSGRAYAKTCDNPDLSGLSAEIRDRVRPALESARITTAVLIPVSLIAEEGFGAEALKALQAARPGAGNILIFYGEGYDGFWELCKDRYPQNDFSSDFAKSVDGLNAENRFHYFGKSSCGDIRNYIMRKMLTDADHRYALIPHGAAEELSEKLYQHFFSEQEVFENIPKNPDDGLFTHFLDVVFSNSKNVEEIISYAQTLTERELAATPGGDSGVWIERANVVSASYFSNAINPETGQSGASEQNQQDEQTYSDLALSNFTESLSKHKLELRKTLSEPDKFDKAIGQIALYLGDNYTNLRFFYTALKRSYYDGNSLRTDPEYVGFNNSDKPVRLRLNEKSDLYLKPYELRVNHDNSYVLSALNSRYVKEFAWRLAKKYHFTEEYVDKNNTLKVKLQVKLPLLMKLLGTGFWLEIYAQKTVENMIREVSAKFEVPADYSYVAKGVKVYIDGDSHELDVLIYFCGQILCIECKTGEFDRSKMEEFKRKLKKSLIKKNNAFFFGSDQDIDQVERDNFKNEDYIVCNRESFDSVVRGSLEEIARQWREESGGQGTEDRS